MYRHMWSTEPLHKWLCASACEVWMVIALSYWWWSKSVYIYLFYVTIWYCCVQRQKPPRRVSSKTDTDTHRSVARSIQHQSHEHGKVLHSQFVERMKGVRNRKMIHIDFRCQNCNWYAITKWNWTCQRWLQAKETIRKYCTESRATDN